VCACDTEIKIACSRNRVRNIFDPATARGEFASSYQMARVYDEIFAGRLPGKMNAWVGGWLDLLHAMAAAKKWNQTAAEKKRKILSCVKYDSRRRSLGTVGGTSFHILVRLSTKQSKTQ